MVWRDKDTLVGAFLGGDPTLFRSALPPRKHALERVQNELDKPGKALQPSLALSLSEASHHLNLQCASAARRDRLRYTSASKRRASLEASLRQCWLPIHVHLPAFYPFLTPPDCSTPSDSALLTSTGVRKAHLPVGTQAHASWLLPCRQRPSIDPRRTGACYDVLRCSWSSAPDNDLLAIHPKTSTQLINS